MTSIQTLINDFDVASRRVIADVAAVPSRAIAVLLLLALVCYLPGLLNVPPVDRTEVYFAKTTQQMVEERNFMLPSDGGRQQMKAVGTYWLQAWVAEVVSTIAGPEALRSISTYRLASMLGSLAALVLLYLLASPLIGRTAAFIAGALYAVTPIVALHAQLAIVEGGFQPFVVAAQLALLRIYAAREGEQTRGLALLFWAAEGASVVINALALPILTLTTIAALFAFDRKTDWLKRLEPAWGIPLMLLLAAPWLLVPFLATGNIPFEGRTMFDILTALGGAQQQEWKALPGSFTLALVLGFLPGALLLFPALGQFWRDRTTSLARFVLAWLIGYLVYLEAISGKPALYTVQVLYPALAIATGVFVARAAEAGPQGFHVPRALIVLAAVLGFVVVPGIAFALHAITASTLRVDAIVALIAFAFACGAAALAAWRGLPSAWLTLSIASFALFHIILFGLVMPRLDTAWPSAHIGPAVAAARQCAPGPLAIAGFREPSSSFVTGRDTEFDEAGEIADRIRQRKAGLTLVAENSEAQLADEIRQRGLTMPTRLGCVDAIDLMLGCRISFAIYATGETRGDCKLPQRYACRAAIATPFKPCKRPKTDPFLAGSK